MREFRILFHYNGDGGHKNAHQKLETISIPYIEISDEIEAAEAIGQKAADFLYVKRGLMLKPLQQSLEEVLKTSTEAHPIESDVLSSVKALISNSVK